MGCADEEEEEEAFASWDDIITMAGGQRHALSAGEGISLAKRNPGSNLHDSARGTYNDSSNHGDTDGVSSGGEGLPNLREKTGGSTSKNTSTQRWRFNPAQDLVMLQEVSIEAQCPYLKKHGEIINAWEGVAARLRAHPLFKNFKAPMTSRTVRERVDRLRNRMKEEFKAPAGAGHSEKYAEIYKAAKEINDMVENHRIIRDKPLVRKGQRNRERDGTKNDLLDEDGLLTRLKEITERGNDSDDGGESEADDRPPSKRARTSLTIDPNVLMSLLNAQQSFKEKELQLRTKEAELLERKIKLEEAKLEQERVRYETEKEEKNMLYSVLLKFADKLDTKKKN